MVSIPLHCFATWLASRIRPFTSYLLATRPTDKEKEKKRASQNGPYSLKKFPAGCSWTLILLAWACLIYFLLCVQNQLYRPTSSKWQIVMGASRYYLSSIPTQHIRKADFGKNQSTISWLQCMCVVIFWILGMWVPPFIAPIQWISTSLDKRGKKKMCYIPSSLFWMIWRVMMTHFHWRWIMASKVNPVVYIT